MKNIIVFTEKYPPYVVGGYEQSCFNIVTYLKKMGFHVSVVTSNKYNSSKKSDDIQNYLLEISVFANFSKINKYFMVACRIAVSWYNFLRTLIYLFGKKFDCCILFKLDETTFSPAVAVSIFGVPIVFDLGDEWILFLHKYFKVTGLKRMVRMIGFGGISFDYISAAGYIANSSYLKNKLFDEGWRACDVSVVPRFLDDHVFGYSITSCIKIISTEVKIIYGGRVCKEKGTDIFVDIINIIKQHFYGTLKVSASIYGISDSDYSNFVYKKIIALGLTDTIKLFKMQPLDIFLPALAEHHFFLGPFVWNEPFGKVIIQSMALGTVPVVSSLAGPSEIIEHNTNGILVGIIKPQSFAREIIRLVEEADEYQKLNRNCIGYARSRYSAQSLMGQYVAAINKFRKTNSPFAS